MKKFTTGLLAGVVLTSSITVFAAGGRMIEVFDNVKKVVVNKVEKPFDKNNKPFVYNGTTYVPLRFVADALGEAVDWDGKTGTVFIGETNNKNAHYWGKDLKVISEDFLKGYNHDGKGIRDNKGDLYKNYLHLYVAYDEKDAYAEFALNGNYKIFKANVGIPESGKSLKGERVVNIYVDDKKIETIILEAGDLLQEVTIDIDGANKIRLELEGKDFSPSTGENYQIAFFNGEFIK